MSRSVLEVVVESKYYLHCHCSIFTSLKCLLAGLNMMSPPHLSALNWAQECWSLTASGSKWAVVVVVVVVVGRGTRPDCLPGRDLNTSITTSSSSSDQQYYDRFLPVNTTPVVPVGNIRQSLLSLIWIHFFSFQNWLQFTSKLLTIDHYFYKTLNIYPHLTT